MTQHLVATPKNWKLLAKAYRSTNEEFRAKRNEHLAILLSLEKAIWDVLDVHGYSYFVFQEPKVYERFSYVDTKQPTHDVLMAKNGNGLDYTYVVAACFNYTKMVEEETKDSLGDEYDCFLVEFNTWEKVEFVQAGDGSEVCVKHLTVRCFGRSLTFHPNLDNFYQEVAASIIEDYWYEIIMNSCENKMRRVRAIR